MTVTERARRSRLRLDSIAACWLLVAIVGRLLFPSDDALSGTGRTWLLVEMSAGVMAAAQFATHGWPASFGWRVVPWLIFLAVLGRGACFAECHYPAMIGFWEWVGALGVWWLAVAVSRTSHRDNLFAAVLALGLGQAALSFWQVGVEFPATRERYLRHDPKVLAEMREMGIEPGSEGDALFRERLMSTEPFGSFAHPNTLAGFFVLALPMGVIACRRRDGRVAPILMVTAILIAIALALTKSRSGWIGAAAALALLEATSPRGRRWWDAGRRWIIGAGAIGLLIVGILASAGLLDGLVVKESFKSMSYRWEWWQASVKVFEESPWWGVGLGNFRPRYLSYKLPFSSEEIVDPHNFLLEWACVAGGVGLAAYWAMLGSELVAAWRASRTTSRRTGAIGRLGLGWWLAGLLAAAGVVIAQPEIWILPHGLLLFSIAWGVIGLCWPWNELDSTELSRGAWSAVIGLHLNELAAGGVAVPGLMLACWGLLGGSGPFAPDQAGEMSSRESSPALPKLFRWMGLPIALGCLAIYALSSVPHWRAEHHKQMARNEQGSRQGSRLREAALESENPDDWSAYARWLAGRMAQQKGRDAELTYREAEASGLRAIELEPRRADHYWMLARLYEVAFIAGLDPEGLSKAIRRLEETVRRYPNSAVRQWDLGRVLERAGQTENARQAYEAALRLDQTPHPDKKLTNDQRQIARRLVP